jgi:hypothetical protein
MSAPSERPHSKEFSTDILYLAGWILATQRLRFLRVDVEQRIAEFIFTDPDSIGESLELEFINGNPLVPIKDLRSALDTLRTQLRVSGVVLRERGGAR